MPVLEKVPHLTFNFVNKGIKIKMEETALLSPHS